MEWNLVVDIVIPVATLILGHWLTRWYEKKPQLVTHYGHVGAFKFSRAEGEKIDVFTHTVVVRNTGKQTANNVRLRHKVLPPHFDVFPDIEHSIVQLPGGGSDILIPKMIPGQEILVAYLYFPPTDYTQINNGVLSDEGFAKEIPMLLQKQHPRWAGVLALMAMFAGIVTILYWIIQLIRHFA